MFNPFAILAATFYGMVVTVLMYKLSPEIKDMYDAIPTRYVVVTFFIAVALSLYTMVIK